MKFLELIKKYWPVLVVLGIVALGTYVRTFDYSYPYLRNIDSYAFTRQIDEISKTGFLLSNDNLALAPNGMPRTAGTDLYVYIMGYGYNFVHFFLPNYTLFQFLIWAPALLASLMAIPMYFIGKILYDKRAGILAAFFIVFDVAIISRTLGGDPDNDGAVLLFPLIVIALFLLAYKYIGQNGFNRKGIFYTIITGIGMSLWAFVWTGFWYVIWHFAGFLIIKILIKLAKNRNFIAIKELKRPIILFLAVLGLFFLITTPVLGTGEILTTLKGPFSFSDIKSEENRPFPNVYVSVAELQSGGAIKDVLERSNVFLFSFMILSLVYLAASTILKKKDHLDTLILLALWFVGPLIATTIGVRFSILFAAPIAIGAAIFISKIFRIIEGEGVTE